MCEALSKIGTPIKDSFNIIDDYVDSIPDYVHLMVNKSTLTRLLMEVINKYKENSTKAPDQVMCHEYYADDVRYTIYYHDEKWVSVCVQDFDFIDYHKENFILEKGYNEDPEMNALSFYRRDLRYIDGLQITEDDKLANELTNTVINCICYVRKLIIE